MSKIDRRFLDCTVYLYRDKPSAEKGIGFGGSGFIVAVPFEQDIDGIRRSHVYVVTNSHVVRETNCPVVRLNRIDGRQGILPFSYDHWIDDWDEDDLALCMLDDRIMNRYRWLAPLDTDIVNTDLIDVGILDVGTEVTTIARFIEHDGKQKNMPVTLFGSVSMMNSLVEHGDRPKTKQESFLVETRAIPGTSGSPVFMGPLVSADSGMVNFLLGIVWGYLYRNEPTRLTKTKEKMKSLHVREHTGMMLVIPGWNLTKFLNRPDLVKQRKKIEEEAIEEAKHKTGGSSSAVAMPDDDDVNDTKFTEEDFERALEKVTRRDKSNPEKKKRKKS